MPFVRSLAVFCLLAVAAFSSAAFLPVWSKTLHIGAVTHIEDIAFDTSGNLYLMGFGGTNDNDVFVSKVNQSGSTLWTNTMVAAENQYGRHIAVDSASGSVYVSSWAETPNTGVLKKLRASDGASQGTLTTPEQLAFGADHTALIIDSTGQAYWVVQLYVPAGAPTMTVYKIDPTTLTNSSFRTTKIPTATSIVQVRPNPTGGALVMVGFSADEASGPTGAHYFSDIYAFGAAGTPAVMPAGMASAFAVDPATGKLLTASVATGTFHFLVRGRVLPGGLTEEGAINNTGLANPYVRDIIVTKDNRGMAVGGYTRSDSAIDTFYSDFWTNNTMAMGGMFGSNVGAGGVEAVSLRQDNFGEVTALESSIASSSCRILELNPFGAYYESSPTYAFQGHCHAMMASGMTAVAGQGSVAVVKPRDLKDIYMGSTTLQGGKSATAIVRMYEPYSQDRTVMLNTSNPHGVLPASKAIVIGQTSASVTFTSTAVTSPETCTLAANYGVETRVFSLTLTP